MVCEKQDKSIPKEDLSKYDSEGNLIKMKEYVHCETQEQYNEILDWLESNGEQVDKGYSVIGLWRYICFENNKWGLNKRVEPQLSKAEFQFKGKSEKQPIKTGPGLRDQMLDYSGYILSDLSIPDFFSTQNSITELNQESSKLLSFEEDDVVLFKTNSVKISNKQLIIND